MITAGVVRTYYDTSRNGTRRWRSMDGCGARAKAARHHQRQRITPTAQRQEHGGTGNRGGGTNLKVNGCRSSSSK
ncbi:CGNR zinc finger domain-containing protein [Micromonospora arida]|uniref:CGNR zinc finger domain-containing protein n=1 Tax=Micromonospora arida TaxID=2203715 RepID=UPI003F4C0190